MKLAFLIERRWAPYSKWLGRAFSELRLAAEVGPLIQRALKADDWRERESSLCAASSVLAEATNRLGLADEVDPRPRHFFDRDIHVLGASRLVTALVAAISDPGVARLVNNLGSRSDGMHRFPGSLDQAVDSVDVLTNPVLRRDAGPALGLQRGSDAGAG